MAPVDDTPKTVLSLICLNPVKFGSYEEFELRLAERMTGAGLRHVKVFVAYPPPNLRERLEESGAVMDFLPVIRSRFAYYQEAMNLFRRYRPQVLHLSFFPILTPLIHLGRMAGIRKILFTDHSSGMPSEKGWAKSKIYSGLNRINSASIHKVLAVSKFVRRRLIEKSMMAPEKVQVVYNGINPERFRPLAHKPDHIPDLELPGGRPVYSVVANLIREKGIDHFLRAAEILIRKGSKATFLVVGTGTEFRALKEFAQERNLGRQVVFTGIRSDVEKLIQYTDVFITPSLWQEAFGLANIEAMSCRLPVISSRVGAIPEVVEDGQTGLLVEPGDPQALADAMERLAADPELMRRLGEAGRQRVLDKFTLDRQVEETFQAYVGLLGAQKYPAPPEN